MLCVQSLHVLSDYQEPLACLDLKDFQERRVQLVAKAVLVHQEPLVTLDPLDPRDFLVTADLLDLAVYLEAPGHLVLLDPTVRQVCKALQDLLVRLDPTVSLVSKAHQAFLVLRAVLELQEALVLLVFRVLLDLKAYPVRFCVLDLTTIFNVPTLNLNAFNAYLYCGLLVNFRLIFRSYWTCWPHWSPGSSWS